MTLYDMQVANSLIAV